MPIVSPPKPDCRMRRQESYARLFVSATPTSGNIRVYKERLRAHFADIVDAEHYGSVRDYGCVEVRRLSRKGQEMLEDIYDALAEHCLTSALYRIWDEYEKAFQIPGSEQAF